MMSQNEESDDIQVPLLKITNEMELIVILAIIFKTYVLNQKMLK
jgi:hypothetical protein